MQGKVILITGGAKRVGAVICRKLHAQGARLIVHYRSSLDEAKALQIELNQQRPNSVVLAQADLLDDDLLPDLVERAAKRFG
ncbi:MAG: SDR family NAD(P)-dependent oxidoreductase, partial [Pseudomonadota bacterium]